MNLEERRGRRLMGWDTKMPEITVSEYNLVYNALSFTIAVMGAATVFAFSDDHRLPRPTRQR